MPDTNEPISKPEDAPITEQDVQTFQRLQRLQEHGRSNLTAVIAQKAMGGFSLQAEALPPEITNEVRVLVYPQDPFVSEPEVRTMIASDIRPGLVNSRVAVEDATVPIASPDDDGHYLYWPGTPEFDQVNCFYYATFTLRMYERYARRALPWAFPKTRIVVSPHAGEQANAFYSERDQKIGFYYFQVDGQVVNAAHSADVVSHETAHAILDGLRDLYNESFGLGPTAFHESFGDITAVLVALHDDSLITRLLSWTEGNLRTDNFVAAVAEEMTNRLRAGNNHVQGHTVYLRNALNVLQNAPFDVLRYMPENPEMELGRESHNYSRLFTGAFYNLMVLLYERLRKDRAPRLALHRTRGILGRLLTFAVELGPVGEFDFGDMARAFLMADLALNNGQHTDLITQAFVERGIFSKKEADDWVAHGQHLPDLRLPESINSAAESATFLTEQVLPVLGLPNPPTDLLPLGAYRDASGYAFLTYVNARQIELKGAGFQKFDGSHIDAFGGLTLAFNAENRLCSAIYRPVTDEDTRQIQILTAELIQQGLVVNSIYPAAVPEDAVAQLVLPVDPQTLWTPDAPPAATTPESAGPAKLVKLPVIFDSVPRHLSHFIEYLRALQQQISGDV